MKAEDVTTRVEALLDELRMTRNEVSAVRAKAAVYKASVMANKAFPVGTSKKIRYHILYLARLQISLFLSEVSG